MDELATLLRGIGRIATALRERANTVQWANASHLHAVADSLEHEIHVAQASRRQWRDGAARRPRADPLEPIRTVFRQCGLYNHAADDLLCQELHDAIVAAPRLNEPFGNSESLPEEPARG